jgi:hypothetical protein
MQCCCRNEINSLYITFRVHLIVTVTKQGGETGEENEQTAMSSNTSKTDQQPVIPSGTMLSY